MVCRGPAEQDPSGHGDTSHRVFPIPFSHVCRFARFTNSAALPVSRAREVLLCPAFALVIIAKQIGTFVVLILYGYLPNYCCQEQFLSGRSAQLSCVFLLQWPPQCQHVLWVCLRKKTAGTCLNGWNPRGGWFCWTFILARAKPLTCSVPAVWGAAVFITRRNMKQVLLLFLFRDPH